MTKLEWQEIKKIMSDIKFDNLCNLIAMEVNGSTPNSVKKYLKGIYKVILQQLKLRNRIYFKGFGAWEIYERKSGERKLYNPNLGEIELHYVKPRTSISFKPSENFEASVNEGNFQILSDCKTKNFVKKKQRGDTNSSDIINKANRRAKKGREKDG